jgi:MFS family permease
MSIVQRFLVEPFSPLKDRNFAIYVTGQTISQIGTWMQTTAQAWLVWELTKDPRMVSLATALGFAPLFFISPFSGVLADRWNRRKVLLGTQITAMILAIILAVWVYTGLNRVEPIFVLALLLGIVNAFDFPAQSAFMGDMVGMNLIRKAVALNTSMFQVGRFVGPAIAGLVVAAFGPAVAFGINGISYIAVIICLLIITTNQVRRSSTGNPMTEFAEAVQFARIHPRILDLIVSAFLVTLFVFGTSSLFAPLASEVLKGGPETLGLISAASGLGALISALFIAPQFATVKRVGLVILSALIWSGMWLMISFGSATFLYQAICIFMLSLALPLILAGTAGLLQTLSPPNMRARLISVFQMSTFGAQPLGALYSGFMGSSLGTQQAILLNGAMMAVFASLLFIFRRDFRRWVIAR